MKRFKDGTQWVCDGCSAKNGNKDRCAHGFLKSVGNQAPACLDDDISPLELFRLPIDQAKVMHELPSPPQEQQSE